MVAGRVCGSMADGRRPEPASRARCRLPLGRPLGARGLVLVPGLVIWAITGRERSGMARKHYVTRVAHGLA